MCWRASLPGKTSCSFSSPRTTTAAVTLYFATTSRSYIFRPIRRSSIRKKISGMKSAKKSSRTMHSNPWTPCAPSSSRPSSISSETPSSFAPLPASPISSTHSDVEMVLVHARRPRLALRSLRLRHCRSSSVADGSLKRSISWLAISRAFAALLLRTPGRWALGPCSVAMIDLHSWQMMSAASWSFLSFALMTSNIIGCVLLQVGHQTRGNRASRPLQPIRKDLVSRFRRQLLAREAMMAAKEISVKKYVVRLSGEERERLETLLRKGKSPARRVLKARILLKADVSEAGKGWSDNRIIEALETSPSMVYRVRKQLVEEGFEAVLSRKPRAMPAVARIFDGEKEAKLIALACSKPPKGRARWTLRLLENKVVELGIVDRASDSTIGRALKKTLFSPIAASTGSSRRRPTARS